MISINWGTQVIFVPRDDLTLIQSSPTEIRELNLNSFRLALKDLEDSEEGMAFPDTHRHNTEVLLGGLTYARVIEILNGYTITFEDGQYAVNLVGANSNVADNVNVNQVSVRTSNSAGLTSSPAVEYASFNDGVTIDVNATTVGTVYPAGTPLAPVNNITDAVTIATLRGFKKLYFLSNFTFYPGLFIMGFDLIGQGPQKTIFTFQEGAITAYCEIYEGYVTGSILGVSGFYDCYLDNFSGSNLIPASNDLIVQRCLIGGTLTLPMSYTGTARVLDSWTASSVKGILDLSGASCDIVIRAYSGGIEVRNCTQPNNLIFDFISGALSLDSSVTAGNFTVRGNVKVENNSTSVTSLDISSIQLPESAYFGSVLIDTNLGVDGNIYPFGIYTRPVKTLNSALTVASLYNIKGLMVRGAITLSSALSGWEVVGEGSVYNAVITMNSQSISSSRFQNVVITGGIVGSYPSFTSCFFNYATNLSGIVNDCSFAGTVSLGPGVTSGFGNAFASTPSIINMVGTGRIFAVGATGYVRIINLVAGSVVQIILDGGKVLIDNSCTGGIITLYGQGSVTNNGTSILVNEMSSSATIDPTEIASAVWDASKGDYEGTDTMGELLNATATGGVDPDALAAAVWDANKNNYNDDGTMGALQNSKGYVKIGVATDN